MRNLPLSQLLVFGRAIGIPVLVSVWLAGCGASSSSGPFAGSRGQADPRLAMNQDITGAIQAADQFTSAAKPGDTAYKIGPLDVLEVSVFQVPELSKTVQVADTGTVNLPLVGEIPASGHTAQQVERDLTARLGAKYLQKPQVTVYVKEYNSQRVTVEGAVKKPGVYPIRAKTSLLQSIAMAEGLDVVADSTVVVFRQSDGRRAAAKFDIGHIRAGRVEDPAIQSGDVIVVSSSMMKETFNALIKLLPATSAFALL
jgi:polysaccharide export outer membrane protein